MFFWGGVKTLGVSPPSPHKGMNPLNPFPEKRIRVFLKDLQKSEVSLFCGQSPNRCQRGRIQEQKPKKKHVGDDNQMIDTTLRA